MTVVSTVKSRDGTDIAFERAGTGPAVILVDAAGCFRGHGPMRPLAERLVTRFTVFSYDRRGRGGSSDTPPYAVDREVEDLQALVEATGGAAFVYGFSSGAVLALHAAARGLAIPRLALLEPPLPLEAPPARLTAVTSPTLVLASDGSDNRLLAWAEDLALALPNATLRTLKGEWHGVPADDLAPVLAAFFTCC